MTLFGLRKSLLLGLVLFVLPVGGLLIFPLYWETTPHSIMQSLQKDGTLQLEDECKGVPDFDEYLRKLNEANKPNNVICKFAGDLTTMSRIIQCEVMHGLVQGQIYWAESLDECNKIKARLQKSRQ